MTSLASFFYEGLFFTPFIYVFLYLYIVRKFSQHLVVLHLLRIITVFFGLFTIVYAYTTPSDFMVLMPSRGGDKVYVSSSVFLMVVGAATMALPLFGKYIKFANRND